MLLKKCSPYLVGKTPFANAKIIPYLAIFFSILTIAPFAGFLIYAITIAVQVDVIAGVTIGFVFLGLMLLAIAFGRWRVLMTMWDSLFLGISLLLYVVFLIWVLFQEEFTFIGTSSVFLAIDICIVVALVYKRSREFECLNDIEMFRELNVFSKPPYTQRSTLGGYFSLLAFVLHVCVLLAYAFLVFYLTDASSALENQYLGFITGGAILVMDFLLYFGLKEDGIYGISSDPLYISILIIISRFSLIVFGPSYWFVGHSFLFFFVFTYMVNHIVESQLGINPGEKSFLSRFFQRSFKTDSESMVHVMSNNKRTEIMQKQGLQEGGVKASQTRNGLLRALALLVFYCVDTFIVYISSSAARLYLWDADFDSSNCQIDIETCSHSQWLLSPAAIFLSLIVITGYMLYKYYCRFWKFEADLDLFDEKTRKVIIFTKLYVLLVAILGLLMWIPTKSYIILFTGIFFPVFIISVVKIYAMWKSNDYVFFRKSSDEGEYTDLSEDGDLELKEVKPANQGENADTDPLANGNQQPANGGNQGDAKQNQEQNSGNQGDAKQNQEQPAQNSGDQKQNQQKPSDGQNGNQADSKQNQPDANSNSENQEKKTEEKKVDLEEEEEEEEVTESLFCAFKLTQQQYVGFLMVLSALFVFFLGLTIELTSGMSGFGWTSMAVLIILVFTIFPILNYFGTLDFNACKYQVVSGIILFSAFAIPWLILQLKSFSGTEKQKVLYFGVLTYPGIVSIIVGLYKWKDSGWKFTQHVGVFLAFGFLVLFGFSISVFFILDDGTFGIIAGGLTAFLLFCIVAYYNYIENDRLLPVVTQIFIGVFVLLILVCSIIIAYTEGNGFFGFSIVCGMIWITLLLMFWHKVQFHAIDNVKYSKSVGLYASNVFPAFLYDIENERIVSEGVFSSAAMPAVLMFFVSISWGILAVVFFEPRYVGLGVASISIAIAFITKNHISHPLHARFAKSLKYLDAIDEKYKADLIESTLSALFKQTFSQYVSKDIQVVIAENKDVADKKGNQDKNAEQKNANAEEKKVSQNIPPHGLKLGEDTKKFWTLDLLDKESEIRSVDPNYTKFWEIWKKIKFCWNPFAPKENSTAFNNLPELLIKLSESFEESRMTRERENLIESEYMYMLLTRIETEQTILNSNIYQMIASMEEFEGLSLLEIQSMDETDPLKKLLMEKLEQIHEHEQEKEMHEQRKMDEQKKAQELRDKAVRMKQIKKLEEEKHMKDRKRQRLEEARKIKEQERKKHEEEEEKKKKDLEFAQKRNQQNEELKKQVFECAHTKKMCTFSVTQRAFIPQAAFYCEQCEMQVCFLCSSVCHAHKGHTISMKGDSLEMYCDCGETNCDGMLEEKAREEKYSKTLVINKNDPALSIARFYERNQKQEQYKDEEFAGVISLFTDPNKPLKPGKAGKWKKYLWSYPSGALVKDGINPNDIKQGSVGDCWFLSALGALSMKPDKFKEIFIQSEKKEDEALKMKWGVYSFKFTKNNIEQIVTVDTSLPKTYANSKRSAFAHSSDPEELWVSLAEKAFAKMYGSFEAIEGGFVDQALADLTGGIPQRISMKDKAVQSEIGSGVLFSKLKQYRDSGFFLGAGSPAGSDSPENASALGIVQGHAYAVLDVQECDGNQLLKLRNPWGFKEWNGKWSDSDTTSWTRRMKTKLRYENSDNGEFWMSFQDFVFHFRNIYICKFFDKNQWPARAEYNGRWVMSKTAGGCVNYDSYNKNPNFRITVTKRTTIVFHLHQDDTRGSGIKLAYLGMEFFDNGGKRCVRRGRGKEIASVDYINLRDISMETRELSPGEYTLVLSTFYPGKETGYCLKMYATRGIKFEPLN